MAAIEQDLPPPRNTFRNFVWRTVQNIVLARAFFGRRLFGGAIGLIADDIAEATNQAFYARLPGHPQQSPDSLVQAGKDRDLFRFRGETTANWVSRVISAWTDYPQGGTPIQLLRVINQWGQAGWARTWDTGLVTLTESGVGTDFSFVITIGFGNIFPFLTLGLYGGGDFYGTPGRSYGIKESSDLQNLLYLVGKWKRSTSKATVRVFWGPSNSIDFTV